MLNRVGKTKNGIETLPVLLTVEYGAYVVTICETAKYGPEKELIRANTDWDFPSVASLFGQRVNEDLNASKQIARAVQFLDRRIDQIQYIPICALDQYPSFYGRDEF